MRTTRWALGRPPTRCSLATSAEQAATPDSLEIRPVRASDADALFASIARTAVPDTIAWDGPSSIDDYRAILGRREREVRAGAGHTFTAVERPAGRPVGTLVLRLELDPACADVGLWLDPRVHRMGHGTEAVRWLACYGFERLDLRRISARIFVGDMASRRVFEKNGFKLVRTLSDSIMKRGRPRDEWLYALERPEAAGDAVAPRSSSEGVTMAVVAKRGLRALRRLRAARGASGRFRN